jgi:2-oxoglutarate dehydrogenase E1 component
MLRHPDASSSIAEFSSGSFLPVRPDLEARNARRILLATGKIGHELRTERKKKSDLGVAITFVEQLYPFPEAEITAELERHPNAEIVWVQEEPKNMGALNYMLPRLRHLAGARPVLSVRRSSSASPATGSAKAHDVEQKALLAMALATNGH